MHTTTYITDKYLLHSTGNYIQHLVIITYNRKNLKSYFHLTIVQLQKVK